MKNLCAISDCDYVVKLLTLFDSLKNTQQKAFTLYVLCLDEKTEQIVNAQHDERLKALSLLEVENQDFFLKYCKETMPASVEAVSNASSQKKDPKYVQYCWALAPYLCWYAINCLHLDDIMYVDSDLYFYRDISGIYEELGDKSVGIIRHRINYIPSVGEYNVGIVYFKNDLVGKSCSKLWKDLLLYPNNPYAKEYGQCGDQKYLELFPMAFGKDNICIIDKAIGHLAPWSVTFHKYKEDKIIWENREQELYFFHFAHFVPDLQNNTYRSSYRNEWVWGVPEKTSDMVKRLYDEYFEATKNVMFSNKTLMGKK